MFYHDRDFEFDQSREICPDHIQKGPTIVHALKSFGSPFLSTNLNYMQ